MSRYLRLRILMLENRQQIEQSKALCRSSRIRRSAIFIQPAFITNPDTMPVKSTHMGTDFGDGTTTMKNPVLGDIKMIANITEPPLQMTFSKPFYREGNIAARSAAMNYQEGYLPIVLIETACFHPANG